MKKSKDKYNLNEELVDGVELTETKNKKTKKHKGLKIFAIVFSCVCFVVILVPSIFMLSIGLQNVDKFSYQKELFSAQKMTRINVDGVRKLNEVKYTDDYKFETTYSDDYIEQMNKFSLNLFNDGREYRNFAFSPVSLYAHFDILSTIADEEYKPVFDELLGLNPILRHSQVINSIELNSYYNTIFEIGSRVFNGLFIDNSLTLNDLVEINLLTDKYVELYGLNLQNQKHVSLMMQWVKEHSMNSEISQEDLNIDELTKFVLASSFYFIEKWYYPYDKELSTTESFLQLDGTSRQTDFMRHLFNGNVYDYGNYISIYDRYYDHNIQFITAKNRTDNIFEIIKDKNFLVEDEEQLESTPIDIKMPKFNAKNKINFDEILKKGPVSVLYDKNNSVFNDAFDGDTENIYLSKTLQEYDVRFYEEGTKVSQLTFSLGGGAAEGSPSEGYSISLDSPFIYIIRDDEQLPVFIGEYSYVQ